MGKLLLERKIKRNGYFFKPFAFDKAKNGKVILLYQGKWKRWRPDQDGVAIEKNNRFLINGRVPCSRKEWCVRYKPKRIITEDNDRFFINEGKTLIYQGKWDDWDDYHDRLFIQKDDEILFCNKYGKDLVYAGEFIDWSCHLYGVIIQQEDKLSLCVYR